MSDPSPVTPTISLPAGFRFDEVLAEPRVTAAPTGPPSLGPLANFVGTWTGRGFNTIFRPDNSVTPTAFPTPVTPVPDNVLELNLTTEQLSFSASLGNVPNRGRVQGDAFLNGVPYVQTIQDVTTGAPTGIHFEPGLWMIVPNTKDPKEEVSLVRMASIPHGTTICAQGTFTTLNGPRTFLRSVSRHLSPVPPTTPYSSPVRRQLMAIPRGSHRTSRRAPAA